jgi:ABC-type Fe3+/spermidine/putrescine transport system ATPase subunit
MRPTTKFVATFIGSVNALEVSHYDRDHGTFEWAGLRWQAQGAAVREWNGSTMVLVRPEDVIIDPGGVVAGEIAEHYFYGSYYRTVVRLEDGTVVADVPRQVGVGLAIGQSVRLRLPFGPWQDGENSAAVGRKLRVAEVPSGEAKSDA